MATTTTNFGWDIPQSTDLVKDGATAIAALGQDIDTAFIDLKGGTTGQVLAKASNTDLDYSWVAQDDSNAIQNAIVDAKGDLIAATANDTPARLAIGSNGQVLTADSTAATGIKWATAAAASPVSANSYVATAQTTTSGSYTGLTTANAVTLTTGTKALVLLQSKLSNSSTGQTARASFAVSGASTVAAGDNNAIYITPYSGGEGGAFGGSFYLTGLTAGSNTFTMQFRVGSGTGTFEYRQITVIDMGS
jgi:hypothetical protein